MGSHDRAAQNAPRPRRGDDLHEAVLQRHHLRARVRRERKREDLDGKAALDRHSLGYTGRRDLGIGEHGRRDLVSVERSDSLTQRVPHRDPTLHRGDAREHHPAGHVAGCVDVRNVRAAHAVDGNLAPRADLHTGVLQTEVR